MRRTPRQSNRCGGPDAMTHPLPTHTVLAFNGALVPGVAVFAYMAHVPVAHFGRAWLAQGEAACRFLKPVYDGDIARVTAEQAPDIAALVRATFAVNPPSPML